MKFLNLIVQSVVLSIFSSFLVMTFPHLLFADWERVNTNGFGDTSNSQASSMRVFENYLHVGTYNEGGCRIWRTSDGTTWDEVVNNAFNDTGNTGIHSMEVFNGNLYAGTENISTGCEIWRSSNGTSWEQVNVDGFAMGNFNTMSMTVFDDYLYVGTCESIHFQVWRTPDGTTWEMLDTTGLEWVGINTCASSITVFNNYLYLGESHTRLWRTQDGNSWEHANSAGFDVLGNAGISSMIAHNDYLYAGVNNMNNCQVWRAPDGLTWEMINTTGFGSGNGDVPSMTIYNNYLYAGTSRGYGCEIWELKGLSWRQVNESGFGGDKNVSASSMVTFNGYLYVGTENVEGCEIWRLKCTDEDSDGYFAEGGYCGTEDCDDNDQTVHPEADEICDGKDNDCDGTVDEGCDTTSSTTTTTASQCPCLIKEIYNENAEEVAFLRNFRDNLLSQTAEGQELIKLYYRWSPVIIRAMEKDEEFREEMKELIDGVLGLVGGEK